MMIKDAMVLIHLAKLSLLESSCQYFKKVMIPEQVYHEILKGKRKGFPDASVIVDLIENKKITVKKIQDKNFIKKANQFNIQRGEAEAVALYWQEKADFLATDDDNVRKKKILLNINIIGTPGIILGLYKKRIINRQKISESVEELRKIGWFGSTVLDKIIMEAEK